MLKSIDARPLARVLALGAVHLVLSLVVMSTVVLAQSGTTTYIIKSGDNLQQIAAAHDTTVEEILALNPGINNANQIYVGATILLPGAPAAAAEPGTTTAVCPNTYTTVAGDTFTSIAKKYNVDASTLAIVNHLSVVSWLAAGTELCIPTAPGTPSSGTSGGTTTTAPSGGTTATTPSGGSATTSQAGEGGGPLVHHSAGRLPEPHRPQQRLHDQPAGANQQHLQSESGLLRPADLDPGFLFGNHYAPASLRRRRHRPPLPPPAPTPAPAAPAPAPAPAPAQPAPQPAPAHLAGYNGVGPWTAQYFANSSLEGAPVVTRQDNMIAFYWQPGLAGRRHSHRLQRALDRPIPVHRPGVSVHDHCRRRHSGLD